MATATACAGNRPGDDPTALTRAELMDPASCQTCHPQQFTEWQGSMHAYAAEDPVFVAMNQRAQREQPSLGDFCVRCHAPVALAEGLTRDGLNLPELPAAVRGVTCYFCHSAQSVDGTHNNPLTLTKDGTIFGPFADPAPGTPHRLKYSPLMDFARPESAAACGSCHDLVNQHGVALERTFQEWQQTLFADPMLGQTCSRCHMTGSQGPASTTSPGKVRPLRSHAFPGVDVALTPFPGRESQRELVQEALDATLQGTLCLTDGNKIEVTLDNAGAGHSWPSGSTQDRRAWVALTAYVGERVIYQSGNVAADKTVETINDSDLWLIRDCIFDAQQHPVHNFWDAVTVAPSNLIPGSAKPSVKDPTTFTRSHVRRLYPTVGALSERPDRITMKLFLKPVGDDVLADLVASGDLDATIAAAVPTFEVKWATTMEWTPTAQAPTDIQTRKPVNGLTCVGNQTQQYRILDTNAISRARCAP